MNDISYRPIVSPMQFTHGGVAYIVHDAPQEERTRRVDLHIESGDYFATLATLTELMADLLETGDAGARAHCTETLHELRTDLMYAHDRYKIVPKD